jgi:hypothetical protein
MSLFFKKTIYLILLTSLVVLLSVQNSFSQEPSPDSKTIIVTGTGLILKNDTASAREKAISESLVTAVGIVMSDVTPPDIFVPNFQSLNEILYTHTDSFINGYRVLAETKYNNRYRVLVQARISIGKIKQQLMEIGIMAGQTEKPRILFFIAEQNIGDILPHYWWQEETFELENKAEARLSEIFTKKGFIVVGHPNLSTFSETTGLLIETPELDQNTVISLAKLAQADIAIVGSAFAEQASNTMGEDTRSFKGTLLARAIRISREDEIGKTFQNVITVNTDEIYGGLEAISGATALAGEDLAIQITSSFTKKENERSKFKIVVEGTRILSNFVKFRRALSSLNNVGEIRSSEMKSNEATLNVEYKGDINTLAKALMLKSFDSFGINISRVLPEQLNIILVPVDKIQESSPPVADFSTEEIQE